MAAPAAYDRAAELRALDATFAGVHGLVAAGATHVPRIFRVADPPSSQQPPQEPTAAPSVPVIDLAGPDRAATVASVRRAAAEWGFFQVTGHGVPPQSMAAALGAARGFHEAPGGEGSDKARLHSREPGKAVKYHCNFDLHQSPVGNWRDTLYLRMAPDPPRPADLPVPCRDALLEYAEQVKDLGDTLFGLLSEALGLNPSHLRDMECNQGQILLCHYFPPCPEPEAAIGTSRHSDSSFLTVLLQDGVGGLQVLHEGRWVGVAPTPGALVVNVGDLLQLISNDGFRSVEHRVVLAEGAEPRVSDGSPALYRETLVRDYVRHYYAIGLDAKTALSVFRL